MRFFIKSRAVDTWEEYYPAQIIAERFMNHKVDSASITFPNEGSVLTSLFKAKRGHDVKITLDDSTKVKWMGQLANFADIDRRTLQAVCKGPLDELKRRRYTRNWVLANGCISTAPATGSGTQDQVIDAYQDWADDAFNTKGVLLRPSTLQRTDTIKTLRNIDGFDISSSGGTYNHIHNADVLTIGLISATYRHGVFRFVLNIPKGATIDSALLRLTGYENNTEGNVTTDIYLFHVNGDARGYRTYRGDTTYPTKDTGIAAVEWVIGNVTANEALDSSDLKTLVQHFIEDPQYSPGNMVGLLVEVDEEDSIQKRFWTSNSTQTSAVNPQLIVTWTSERIGQWYVIDDTVATNGGDAHLVCTDDDLEADGLVANDVYYVGESDKTIIEDIINSTRSLTPNVKATTSYTALFYQRRFKWDILMDHQLKLGYDLWNSLDGPLEYTCNFTDAHTASGRTFTLVDVALAESVKRLYNTDEYYTSCEIVGARHSPAFVVTAAAARYVECTGSFEPGVLAGRNLLVLNNESGGASAIGRRYGIIGNSGSRVILEIDCDIATDGLGVGDTIMIEDGDFLQCCETTPDKYELGRDFLIDDPGIMTPAEAQEYMTQVLANLGADIDNPLVIWERVGCWEDLDVGYSLTLTFDELAAVTYVITYIKYTATQHELKTEYWMVPEI